MNSSNYDDVQGVCIQPPQTTPTKPPPVASGLDAGSASAELVKRHDQCAPEKVALAQAAVALAGSVAAIVVASRTVVGALPSLAAFVAASIGTGKAAAELANCKDAQAIKSVSSGL